MRRFLYRVIVTVSVIVVNMIIEKIVKMLTSLEKRFTHTNWELSLVYKLTLIKFLNTCAIPLAGYNEDDDIFKNNGLIEEITIVIIAVFIGEIIRVWLYPKYLARLVIRKWEMRKGDRTDMTQKEANEI
jgi:hypothetical protein